MFVKERLQHVPALVLDVRDRYAEKFITPGRVARPTEAVRVLAQPTSQSALDGWPFVGAAELMTVPTPSGLLVLFDLVRGLKRTPPVLDALEVDAVDPYPPGVDPPLRIILPAGQYLLRLICAGFQEAQANVTLPAPDSVHIDMLPGATYPFPSGRRPNGNEGPTLLRGTALLTDGSAVPNVTVQATSHAGIPPTVTGTSGEWVLVLDPEDDLSQQPAATEADLLFSFPEDGQIAIPTVPFEIGTTTALPQTSLRGQVRDTNGLAIGSATISVDGFQPVSRSRSDGAWAYYLPLALRPPGEQLVTIHATTADGRSGTIQATLTFNTTTRVPPIVV